MPRLVVPHSDIPGSGKSAERCFCARKICKIVRKRKEKNSSNCCELFVSFCKKIQFTTVWRNFLVSFAYRIRDISWTQNVQNCTQKEKKKLFVYLCWKNSLQQLDGFLSLFFRTDSGKSAERWNVKNCTQKIRQTVVNCFWYKKKPLIIAGCSIRFETCLDLEGALKEV